jgi:uncharacterized protein (DUF362 family)
MNYIYQSNELLYPVNPPFHPDRKYSEYLFENVSNEQNNVYSAFREIFFEMGFDKENFGKKEWNPLGIFIRPGNKVLIKPNLVRHYHETSSSLESLVTHSSIIRVIVDFVIIAIKGDGIITIGDAPLQSCDFEKLIRNINLDKIMDFYRNLGINIRLVDFRKRRGIIDSKYRYKGVEELPGDDWGYTVVDLGKKSALNEIVSDFKFFSVGDYSCAEMNKHHNEQNNEYLIPNTVLFSDVVINVPKLKTHLKSGITCAMKNLVGINGNKDWLPHYRIGIDDTNKKMKLLGFEKKITEKQVNAIEKNKSIQSRFWYIVKRLIQKTINVFVSDLFRDGCWFGNDTLWRTIVDLNRLLIFADRTGVMTEKPQRRIVSIVDGIIAGEKEGPMNPSAVKSGLLAIGVSSFELDRILCKLIGFNPDKIGNLNKDRIKNVNDFVSNKFKLSSNQPLINLQNEDNIPCIVKFQPSKGWQGVINK